MRGRSSAAAWSGRTSPIGAYTWWRRPGSRFGVIVAELGVGFAVAVAQRLERLARPHDRPRDPRRRRRVRRLRVPLLPPGPARDSGRTAAHHCVRACDRCAVARHAAARRDAARLGADRGLRRRVPRQRVPARRDPRRRLLGAGLCRERRHRARARRRDRAARRQGPLAGDPAAPPRPARPRLGDRARGGVLGVHGAPATRCRGAHRAEGRRCRRRAGDPARDAGRPGARARVRRHEPRFARRPRRRRARHRRARRGPDARRPRRPAAAVRPAPAGERVRRRRGPRRWSCRSATATSA